MTLPPPPAGPPTLVRCPACGAPFPWPPTTRCRTCAVDLTSDAATRIWEIDRQLSSLTAERAETVGALATTRPAPAPAPVGAPAPGAGPSPVDPSWAPPAPPRAPRPPLGVPTLLGLAGATLLTAAAAVFTAVAWDALPLAVKALLLVAATVASGYGALALHRRDIPIAAASLGLLTMALVVVDVVGSQRAGLLTTDELVPGIAMLGAGVVGGWLSSRHLRWTGPVGAVIGALGAATLTAGIADLRDLGAIGLTLLGTTLAAGVAASAAVWPERIGRVVLAVAGVAGITISGLVVLFGIADGDASVGAGLAALALPVVLLLAGTVRSESMIAPVVLLLTIVPPAVLGAVDAEPFVIATMTMAGLAALAWGAASLDTRRVVAAALGAIPATAIAFVPLAEYGADGAARLADQLQGFATTTVDAWGAVAWVVVAAGVLSQPAIRRRYPAVLVIVTALVTPALPQPATWIALLVAGAVGVLAVSEDDDLSALLGVLAGVAAILWAAPEGLLLAVAGAATVGLAGAATRRTSAWTADAVATVGLLAVGTTAGALADAAGTDLAIALGAGLVALAAAGAGARVSDVPGATVAAPITLAVATVVTATTAPSARTSGVLLLVAAVGWLGQAVLGDAWARWLAVAVASAGNAVLLADADVTVVEAYTAVPAALLAVVGVLWLREERDVPTLVALWPALSVGLVPSLVVLAAEPEALARTLALTAAAGLLAYAGLQLRWRALVVAGGAAATWVALTQLSLVVEVLPRWVTFGIVGLLLVWLAATYEQQQRRIVGVGRRLLELR